MVSTPHDRLQAFLAESNKIEGIYHVRPDEIEAAERFLVQPSITIPNVSAYVTVTARAELRDRPGMDVRIGNYLPMGGGPDVVESFQRLLGWINNNQVEPFDAHRDYERIHPYMDGNGRSGRLIWLWHMNKCGRATDLGFLHHWYYQSLKRTGRG